MNMDNVLDDQHLLERIRRGEPDAFRILFDRHWEGLYLFAWKRLKCRQEAEDVVQHVFMKIWEHRGARNIQQSIQAYLYKSVYYEVIAALKKMSSANEDVSTIADHTLPIFSDVLVKLSLDELNAAINKEIEALPDRMKLIYKLSREENYSIREIAEKLDLSEQSVKNRLTIALTRLRKPITEALLLLLMKELIFP